MAKISGTVTGQITYNGEEVEYTAVVSGDYWEDPGDRWTPPSSDSEGPFFESVDETNYEDYEQHQDEIDKLIKEDVEEHKEWDSCEWDWDDDEPPYDDPPEEGGRYNWDPAEED
jgi:hypothetical protein